MLRKYKNYTPQPYELSFYGGHYGVSRSMIEGLEKVGYTNFNFNPSSTSEVGQVAVVISGIQALRQAIKWKKSGKIKKLIAGPNICVLPTEYPEISSPEIDVYLNHSQWTADYYQEMCPALKGKMRLWPAGVDEKFWDPDSSVQKNGKRLLFYNKRPEKQLYEKCKQKAEENGFEVIELQRGGYTLEDYKELLNKVDFLVHFVEQESQGISLSESWSMNVPTIVWNPGNWSYNLMNIKCSSAPYLVKETGLFFRDEEDFSQIITKGQLKPEAFDARKWLICNLTDAKSAEILLNIVNSIA